MFERALHIPDRAHRADLKSFIGHVVRLDQAAVIRLHQRDDGLLSVWAATGFDALATRSIEGVISPSDMTVAADQLFQSLELAVLGEPIDPGFSIDSAWRGALAPEQGFSHIDDVPAQVLINLAQRGVSVSKEHSAGVGPPVSLLDQEVIAVEGNGLKVTIPMRCVFALTAMGFIPDSTDTSGKEWVRVRASDTWLRLDARFGSVYRRRGRQLDISVTSSK
ncbi:MAG: hypothetical protein ACRCSF_02630 [Mycobacteriaceae bacterium]